MKHTPGPWQDNAFGVWQNISGKCHCICTVTNPRDDHHDHRSVEEAFANAALIAQAPEMRKALEFIIQELTVNRPNPESLLMWARAGLGDTE